MLDGLHRRFETEESYIATSQPAGVGFLQIVRAESDRDSERLGIHRSNVL